VAGRAVARCAVVWFGCGSGSEFAFGFGCAAAHAVRRRVRVRAVIDAVEHAAAVPQRPAARARGRDAVVRQARCWRAARARARGLSLFLVLVLRPVDQPGSAFDAVAVSSL
jgi:hypothetical protein